MKKKTNNNKNSLKYYWTISDDICFVDVSSLYIWNLSEKIALKNLEISVVDFVNDDKAFHRVLFRVFGKTRCCRKGGEGYLSDNFLLRVSVLLTFDANIQRKVLRYS